MPLLKIMHITPIWPQSYWRPFGIYFHYFIQIFHVTSMDYNAPWALVNPLDSNQILGLQESLGFNSNIVAQRKGSIGAKIQCNQ